MCAVSCPSMCPLLCRDADPLSASPLTTPASGLGALLCEGFAREGSNVAVNYNASPEQAAAVAAAVDRHGVRSVRVQGDVGLLADCERIVAEAAAALGGLDVIVNNAGWTRPCPFGQLDAMTEAEWDRSWAVNTKSNLHLLRAALPTFNANPHGGSFVVTSSIAASIPSGSSMAYSVSKAAGLHLVTCLAETQGPKVRVNAIQPGFLKTEWGNALPEATQKMALDLARLKQDVRRAPRGWHQVLTASRPSWMTWSTQPSRQQGYGLSLLISGLADSTGRTPP